MMVEQILQEWAQQQREGRARQTDDNLWESLFTHMVSNII